MRRLQAAIRAFIDAWRAEPFFGDDDEALTDAQWAGMLVLHAEAVHGCTHTEQAREEIGMSGPRAEAAS